MKDKSKVAKKTVKPKKSEFLVDVYNTRGEIEGQIELPKEFFGEKINENLIAQAVRVYLANQRVGAASTKTRGEVSGGGRKPWRQKGTGRARAGSIRAPQFRGGGVVFGPKTHLHKLTLPQKMRQKALVSALSQKFKEGQIKVIVGLLKIEPKTKKMSQVLTKLLSEKRLKTKVLLVLPKIEENLEKAARNLENLKLEKMSNLTTYQVMNCQKLLFLKETIEILGKDGN